LTEGRFSWGVQSIFSNQYSGYTTQELIVDTTLPGTPNSLVPEDKTILSSTNVSFKWSGGAIGLSPEFDSVYVATDDNFNNYVTKGKSNNKQYNTILEKDTYYWKVTSYDMAGNKSNASGTLSFTIQ
ncbi:MAG: hypothetical protein ACN4ES_06015, partial [Cellulophaga baltica]